MEALRGQAGPGFGYEKVSPVRAHFTVKNPPCHCGSLSGAQACHLHWPRPVEARPGLNRQVDRKSQAKGLAVRLHPACSEARPDLRWFQANNGFACAFPTFSCCSPRHCISELFSVPFYSPQICASISSAAISPFGKSAYEASATEFLSI